MMSSISNMEEIAQVQVSSNLEFDTTEVLVQRMNRDPELQPESEMMSEDDIDEGPIYEGPIPEPHQQMSPESIAGWMVKRLSRRIYPACVSGTVSLRRYIAMRELMRGTVRICQRSELERRRAMFVLHDIRDLSEHSSSDESNHDPMEKYIELLGDDGMDMSESYQGDFYDFQERVYGPMDAMHGAPQRAATIPAYVIDNGRVIYTIEAHELPEESEHYAADGDWVDYTSLGNCYCVRNFPTRDEVFADASASSA